MNITTARKVINRDFRKREEAFSQKVNIELKNKEGFPMKKMAKREKELEIRHEMEQEDEKQKEGEEKDDEAGIIETNWMIVEESKTDIEDKDIER